MSIYFDAVLTSNMMPIFNGTPEQTVEWLKKNPDASNLTVCIGKTLQIVTVAKYLSSSQPKETPTGTIPAEICPAHPTAAWELAGDTWVCIKCINEL